MPNKFNYILKSAIIFLCFVFSPFTLAAKTYTPSCPKEIKVKEELTTSHSGWRTFTSPTSHYFSSVRMFVGEPENQADLVPLPQKSADKNITWKFNSTDKIYIVCEYNETQIQLTQALPDHIQTCTAQVEKYTRNSKGGFIPTEIICRFE